jgi:hypothetical protein
MIEALVSYIGIWCIWGSPLLHSCCKFFRGDYDRHWVSYWVILSIITFLELYVFRIESDITQIFHKSIICVLLSSEKARLSGSLWETSAHLLYKVKENLQESKRLKELAPEKLEAMTNIAMSFDIEQLSKYMEDDETLPVTKFPLHPWAEKPKSLASLAVARVGFLAAENVLTDKQLTEIMDFYVPEKIFEFLESEHLDRRQNGLLALSFLLDIENSNLGFNISFLVYQNHGCEKIMKFLDDKNIDVKLTAIHCFFHLLKYHTEIQRWFIDNNGILKLKEVLFLNDKVAILEGTLTLLQMVTVIFT